MPLGEQERKSPIVGYHLLQTPATGNTRQSPGLKSNGPVLQTSVYHPFQRQAFAGQNIHQDSKEYSLNPNAETLSEGLNSCAYTICWVPGVCCGQWNLLLCQFDWAGGRWTNVTGADRLLAQDPG